MNASPESVIFRQRANALMRPAAEPVTIEGAYTQTQYHALMDVVRQNGPWPTILAHHFTSVEQVVATTSGKVEANLTLDDLTRPNFRGFFAENSVCYYPELYDSFHNRKFLDLVKAYWKAEYAKPTLYLFNFNTPMAGGARAHVDATTFRGVRIEDSPVWLQNVMTKSGLFTDYVIKMGQVITWWYKEGIGGSFTYWPDGPFAPSKAIHPPMWNRAVVVQNELMFHRGDASGEEALRNSPGVKFRSLLQNDKPDRDRWIITTDGQTVGRYHTDQMRFLVHWNAEVYMDMAECKKVMDHTDDLTHDQVFETLFADLRARKVAFKVPSDPLHDDAFVRVLIETYDVTPDVLDIPPPAAVS
jgi:hypothetical protein